jgi:Predicted membrane protein
LRVDQRYRYVYKPLVLLTGLAPFAWMLAGVMGWFGHDLGADPVDEVLHATGKTALNFLMLTLLVTPVRYLARSSPMWCACAGCWGCSCSSTPSCTSWCTSSWPRSST